MATHTKTISGASFVRNFPIILYQLMSRSTYTPQLISDNGDTRGWFIPSGKLLDITEKEDKVSGIYVGAYGAPTAWQQYDLGAHINTLTESSQTYTAPGYITVDGGRTAYGFEIIKTFENNTGAAVTVREVGLFTYYDKLVYDDNTSDNTDFQYNTKRSGSFLLARDVIPEVTLKQNDSLTIRYQICFYTDNQPLVPTKNFINLLYVAMTQMGMFMETIFDDQVNVEPSKQMFTVSSAGGYTIPMALTEPTRDSIDNRSDVAPGDEQAKFSKRSGDIIGAIFTSPSETIIRHRGEDGLVLPGTWCSPFNEDINNKTAFWYINRLIANPSYTTVTIKGVGVSCIGTDNGDVFEIFSFSNQSGESIVLQPGEAKELKFKYELKQ